MMGQLPRASSTAGLPLPAGTPIDGRWRVVRALGGSHASHRYEVRDQGSEPPRLLTLFPASTLPAPTRAQFEHEIALAAAVLGEQALRGIAVGIEASTQRPYLVSELPRHPDLGTRIRERGPLDHGELARFLTRLAPLLDRLHGAGLVHGHLEPGNLFIGPQLEVTVSDCGVGALGAALPAAPGWCAPELLAPEGAATPACDLYTVGLLAFFALTGHEAFPTASDRAELRDLQLAGLRGPSARAATLGRVIDTRLDRWFWRALDPQPERRFRSAAEMVVAWGAQLGLELEVPTAPREPAPPDTAQPTLPQQPMPTATPARPPQTQEAPPPGVAAPASPQDPGIVAVSVKPLLFAGDLGSLRTAESRPDRVPPPGGDTRSEPAPDAPEPAPPTLAEPPAELPPRASPLAGAQPTSEGLSARAPALIGRGRRLLAVGILLAVTLLLGLIARAAFRAPSAGDDAPPNRADATTTRSAEQAGPMAGSATPGTAMESAPQGPAAPSEPARPSGTTHDDAHRGSDRVPKAPATGGDELASVRFSCAPVACQSVFCNAVRYDSGAVTLRAGRYTCKGAARGFGTKPVTLDLEPGQSLEHRFEMVPR